MSNGGYSVDNLVAAAASTLTVSGSLDATNYPSSLLADAKPAPQFKSNGKAGVWSKLDAGVAKTVKLASLLNHNLTSGATVRLQANSSDSWASPPYDVLMTWRATHIWLVLEQTYRWWRHTIEDAANPSNVRIGEWHLSEQLVTFARNFNFPARDDAYQTMTSEGFSGDVSGINYGKVKKYQLYWPTLKIATEYPDVSGLLEAVGGGPVRPICFLPDVAGAELIYAKLVTSNLGRRESHLFVKDVTVDLVEVPNGLSL